MRKVVKDYRPLPEGGSRVRFTRDPQAAARGEGIYSAPASAVKRLYDCERISDSLNMVFGERLRGPPVGIKVAMHMMMEKHRAITEVRINSLGDLIDAVTPAEPDAKTGRRRDVGIYRGMHDPDWPLLTSLDQLGGVNPPHTKADVEEHVLRNFIRYSRPHLTAASVNEWELLVLAQHHGLPTRLLDWSYSPLVAAHFATVNVKHDSDRVVWRLDWQMVHRKFGLPELALLPEDIQKLFGEDEPFTPWKLMRAGTAARDFACMIEPPSLDSRIEAQCAVFSLCSDKRRSLAEFLTDYCLADALTRFIIPAAEVARIRDQLDLVGIDERLIFPDLDGVAAKIRRYYS